MKILLSRTDKIGDVVLTLPLAGLLKRELPDARISFLGQRYTRAIIESSRFVDEFHDWGALSTLSEIQRLEFARDQGFDAIIHVFPRREIASWAHKAGIPRRVGTTHRLYHLWTCNHWISLSRRHSPLHEAQLNLALGRPLLKNTIVRTNEIHELYGMRPQSSLPADVAALLDPRRVNVVLHPKSKGSAREWPTENFVELARTLPADRFRIFVTGGPEERDLLAPFFPQGDALVTNLAGRLSLEELVSFLGAADGIVAASTGPLHIAAALGRQALGLYPPIEPMHPARWGPLGSRATALCVSKRCDDCRKGGTCACMAAIGVSEVREHLLRWNPLTQQHV